MILKFGLRFTFFLNVASKKRKKSRFWIFKNKTLKNVFSNYARYLGVVIDSQLSLSAHVTAVCRSVYCQLPQLRQAV